ncbi:MAG: HEAT repeat domain-containing protein [Planctomycetota bacterium]|nr:MAG: HEAT repeat domain-containing protein [Planctomycetota bacterium]
MCSTPRTRPGRPTSSSKQTRIRRTRKSWQIAKKGEVPSRSIISCRRRPRPFQLPPLYPRCVPAVLFLARRHSRWRGVVWIERGRFATSRRVLLTFAPFFHLGSAMHSRLSGLLLVVALLTLVVSGCAETADQLSYAISKPFQKTEEELYGIKSPADRVDEFRDLAKKAKKTPPAEQEAIVARLADEYGHASDPWVRREILRALAEFPQPAAGSVLVRALGDGDVETRRTACRALGVRGDDIAVRELARVISAETDPNVRIAAVKALGLSENKQALVPLAEAMYDSNPALQAQAQQSLVAVSGRDYGSDIEAWREFAQTGKTDASEISLAEKLRRALY